MYAVIRSGGKQYRVAPGETIEVERLDGKVGGKVTFDNVLAPGRYAPIYQLANRGSGLDMIDRFEGGFSFVVTGPTALGGVVDLPVRSAVTRVGAPLTERTRA